MFRLAALILAVSSLYSAPSAAPNRVDFARDVRPILSDTCFTCHGPDEKQRMANLRLDTQEGAQQVIVPGDSAKSKLFQRVAAEKKALRMPPASSERTLTPQQIDVLKRWIDQGAKWETHWSYLPPKRLEPPAVKGKSWIRNPVDQFVLARLEKEAIKPSAAADKTTLLRRVTFDLTGLPPAPSEIDAFLKDKSPDAYEKAVDRLLASPRYGERMTMQWLDLARYADTHGYHIDSHRDMWPWRDWVIKAFNSNMPFDRFTVEQIAGDLLPNATLEQRIATGFHRNHMINYEGGAIPEEYLVEYVTDRVETTSTVWLGMTMGCARCHDHKYDPIKQKDFYRFFAFFNSISEKGLDGRRGNAEPLIPLPSAAQKMSLERLEERIAAAQSKLPEKDVEARQRTWEESALAAAPEPPRGGLQAHYELDGNLADSSGGYKYALLKRGELNYSAGPVASSADLNGEVHIEFPQGVGPADRADAFTIAAWLRTGGLKEMHVLQKVARTPSRTGYEMLFDDSEPMFLLKRGSRLHFRLIHKWPEEMIEVRTVDRILQAKDRGGQALQHIAIAYDGSAKAAGVRIALNGRPLELEVLRDRLAGSFANDAPLELGNKETGSPFRGQIDDLRFYSRVLAPEEIERLAVHVPARATLMIALKKRSRPQADALRDYFLTRAASVEMRAAYRELQALREEKQSLEDTIPSVMVMKEAEKPRETFVLARGDYRNKTEKVTAGVPSALPPLSANAPPNRLGLAQWLVDPSNPLTARVAVNRFWQMYFGQGLVKTGEDFGSQGEPPSHPELLDWLATEFVRTGWDVKAMQRLIVTSATYRQSSRSTPAMRERDPDNRLLARGPRFRLPAEVVRDNALAVSGLINDDIGGASVYPYQPKGLWEDIAYGDIYSAQVFVPSSGRDLYRRSMYTFWKRTMPPPSLATFDAPDREKCTARRPLTNTPLQALVLMNDPTYVEASRALAQRMLSEGGGSDSARLTYGFRLVTGRDPAAVEKRVLTGLYKTKAADYARDTASAAKLLSVGESKPDARFSAPELAAWTTVASVILNLDEAITKE